MTVTKRAPCGANKEKDDCSSVLPPEVTDIRKGKVKISKGHCLIACLLATCCHQISKEIAERGELGEGCCLFPTSDCRKDFPLVIAGKIFH